MENINKGFKIDRAKWKAALDANIGNSENLTKLYSIRAHSRGRLHRFSAKLNWYEWRKLPSAKLSIHELYNTHIKFTENDGVIKFYLTLEDQTAYIGNDWKEYVEIETVVTIKPNIEKIIKNKWWHIWK